MSGLLHRLPSVRAFLARPLSADRLATALAAAGFIPELGFAAFKDEPAQSGGDVLPIVPGSLLIIDEVLYSSTLRTLQRDVPAEDLASVCLVLRSKDSEPDAFARRSSALRSGLNPAHTEVAIVPATANEEGIASSAATLVGQHRTNSTGVLLWILDDDGERFRNEGCWAHLLTAAKSVARLAGRLRVVQSVVQHGALNGAVARTALVEQWRERILMPARERGTPLVMVTDNQFSERETHLGEAWAATVAQWLPTARVFVASIVDIELQRPAAVQAIWIGVDGELPRGDILRVLSALEAGTASTRPDFAAAPPSPDSAAYLARCRPRALALATAAFRDVWPELLSLPDAALLVSLHHCMVNATDLRRYDIDAIWKAMDWTDELAAALSNGADGVLSRWIDGLSDEQRHAAVAAWSRTLAPIQVGEATIAPARPRPATKTKYTFLVVIDEWASHHGGLSTFNRELCLALARAGHAVSCVLIRATDAEVDEAWKKGVRVLRRMPELGELPLVGLHLPQPDGEEPCKPDFIIGHGRITGAAARKQSTYFRGARRIHFFHMAPEDIEPHKVAPDPAKPRDFAAIAAERMGVEVRLARDAALVVGVGPYLEREIRMALTAERPPPATHRFDPGVTIHSSAERVPLPNIHCLVLGRMEDYPLKGLDLAANALGSLAGTARHRYDADLTLVVRGVPPGEAEACLAALQRDAGPQLRIRVRNYAVDPEALATDFLQASLVLMPSKTEGFGLVGLEAIAAGTPVLVSRRSGLADLLLEHRLDDKVVVETTGDLAVDTRPWQQAIDLTLVDRPAAFRRAAALREKLSLVCTWDGAVAKLVQTLAALDATHGA